MRLSTEHVQELQSLLKTEFGLDFDNEHAQQAGLAIMRFVISKHRRSLVHKEKNDGNDKFGTTKVRQVGASNSNN
jgi:hypothetical protein